MKWLFKRLLIWWYGLCPICESKLTEVGEMVSPVFLLECFCPKLHYLRKRAMATGTPVECFREDAEEYLSVVCGIDDGENPRRDDYS